MLRWHLDSRGLFLLEANVGFLMYDQKGKAALLSKRGGVENGNRPTKHFFNFERKNYNKNTTTELRRQDDSTSCNEENIWEAI